MNKRVTVVDVARAAGVSPGTVSNSLSGKRHVDEETRRRIETAIQDLGYRPNLAARRMRTGQTTTIAIVSPMPAAVAAGPSKLGFMMEIAASAAVAALERNTSLILVPPIKAQKDALTSMAMDGALVVEPEESDPILRVLVEAGIPTVCIGESPIASIPCVRLDYPKIATLLIEHLLEAGARHFPLVVGASKRAGNLAFEEVYDQTCARLGLEALKVSIPEENAEQGAFEVTAALINQGRKFDGLLVPTDAMATGAMEALRQFGIPVPDQVKVVTRYDGFRARTEAPPLTALDLKLDAVAQLATDSLLEIIINSRKTGNVSGPPPTLIKRPSSWCLDTDREE